MIDQPSRVPHYEELLRRFASAVRAGQLYAADHPLLGRNVEGLLAALESLHQHLPSVTVGIVGSQFVVADTPLPKVSAGMKELISRLQSNEIERISFDRGATGEEIGALIRSIAALGSIPASAVDHEWNLPHIRVGRITDVERGSGGIASDMAAIRQLYSRAVAAAQVAWESAATRGAVDLPAARVRR